MPNTSNKKAPQNEKIVKSTTDTKENTTHALKKNKEDAVETRSQASSSPMGGENNMTGNSSDRQGDTSNSSGGSYQKSNKRM